MAIYYVSKSGNDANAGTSEVLAWLTVTKAFQTLQAGDTCYIAPGTYREKPVMSNAGADGNIILIQGDPDCEHFVNENKGIVRITGCDTDEIPASSGSAITCMKNYVTMKNFIVDGVNSSAIHVGSGRSEVIFENIVGVGDDGFYYGTCHNCVGIGSTAGFYYCTCYNCIGIGRYGFYHNYNNYNCIGMGSYAYHYSNNYNCFAIGSNYGFYHGTTTRYTYNSIAVGCYYGFAGGSSSSLLTAYNCLAMCCNTGFFYVTRNDCKYSICNTISTAGSGDTTEAPVILWTLNNMQKIIEAFEPWMFEGAKQWGTTDGITILDTDILGRPRQMLTGGLDIGPYAFSDVTPEWVEYDTVAPGVSINAKGQKVFKVSVEGGQEITVTCKCKHQNTSGDKPQLILRGGSITTQTDTCVATADTWDTLTVTATPSKDDELEIICYARDTGSIAVAYFSDIEVS